MIDKGGEKHLVYQTYPETHAFLHDGSCLYERSPGLWIAQQYCHQSCKTTQSI